VSEHIYKRHNKSLLLYHIVCPAKYRRKVFTEKVAKTLKEVCIGIDERYEIHFVEIGVDEEHVHFLVQSVPMLSPRDIVKTIKSITGKEIFKRHPEVKKLLWGGNFWTSGYYVNSVGRYGNEETIANYVKSQGRKYQQIYRNQLELFDDHIQ
jgi:putative transposase